MADEKPKEGNVLQIVQTPRTRRRDLHPLLRNGIIAAFGAISAALAFYVLRKMGF